MSRTTKTQQLLAALVHDVGKYVARTARNLGDAPSTPLAAPVFQMLLDDCFGSATTLRPSLRFAELRGQLIAVNPNVDLSAVATGLCELDSLESLIRADNAPAVARAVALAKQIEADLRAHLTRQTLPRLTTKKKL